MKNSMLPAIFGLDDFYRVERELEDAFDSIFKLQSSPVIQQFHGNYPKINILENKESLEIVAAVPGLKKDDIEVNYKDGHIIIKGVKTNSEKEQTSRFICREIKRSSFSRAIRINESLLDVDTINCAYENGEITITVPKKKEVIDRETVRKIDIL